MVVLLSLPKPPPVLRRQYRGCSFNGNTWTYTYDAANRLTSYVDAAGYTHSYTYDGNGNILTETDGNGNTTH